jgi:hypothetical protein
MRLVRTRWALRAEPGSLRNRWRAVPATEAGRTPFSFRKEVIQPQVLLRLPCYDFTPIMNYTLGGCSLAVSAPTSSATHFRDVTGGVYKARERIHRGMLIHDY